MINLAAVSVTPHPCETQPLRRRLRFLLLFLHHPINSDGNERFRRRHVLKPRAVVQEVVVDDDDDDDGSSSALDDEVALRRGGVAVAVDDRQ